MMNSYASLRPFILRKLDSDLPDFLTYHNRAHTEQVMDAAMRLADLEKIDGNDRFLLEIAALMHDTGFLSGMQEHERRSCEFARATLPGFGVRQADIERICTLILATKMPQTPHCLLAQVLCDADLFHLGSAEAAQASQALFSEFRARGIVATPAEMLDLEIEFISNHRYFTASARTLLRETKLRYLAGLQGRRAA